MAQCPPQDVQENWASRSKSDLVWDMATFMEPPRPHLQPQVHLNLRDQIWMSIHPHANADTTCFHKFHVNNLQNTLAYECFQK